MLSWYWISTFQSCVSLSILKSQYVQQKVTDFHKSVDTLQISHEAKLRELAYPFVKYAKVANMPRNIDSYYIDTHYVSIDSVIMCVIIIHYVSIDSFIMYVIIIHYVSIDSVIICVIIIHYASIDSVIMYVIIIHYVSIDSEQWTNKCFCNQQKC